MRERSKCSTKTCGHLLFGGMRVLRRDSRFASCTACASLVCVGIVCVVKGKSATATAVQKVGLIKFSPKTKTKMDIKHQVLVLPQDILLQAWVVGQRCGHQCLAPILRAPSFSQRSTFCTFCPILALPTQGGEFQRVRTLTVGKTP